MPQFTLSLRLKHFGSTRVPVEATTLEVAIEQTRKEYSKKWEIEHIGEYNPPKLSDTERAALESE
jgi:hypothetical protein